MLISYNEVVFVILRTERFKFLASDDRSIDNGFDLRLCLGISRIQDTRMSSINLRQGFTILESLLTLLVNEEVSVFFSE